MRFVKGPDFPTRGVVVRDGGAEKGLSAAYGTGRGRITARARVHLEGSGRGRNRLIITEVPFQVNKSGLLERIAELGGKGAWRDSQTCATSLTARACGWSSSWLAPRILTRCCAGCITALRYTSPLTSTC